MIVDRAAERVLFKDAELEGKFCRDGYVRVPLLNSSMLDLLERIYHESESRVDLPFYTSIWSGDRDYRAEIDIKIKAILVPLLEPLLIHCKPVFANLMVKKPVVESKIGLHQDWTLVDESLFRAVNVWIPLVETNETNGTLQIVNRSHLMKINVRGRNIPSQYDGIQSDISKNYLTSLAVAPGEAIIFDERLLHCSPDNSSDFLRLAVSIVMIPKEAQIIHYVAPHHPSKSLFKLYVSPSFFTEYGLFDDLSELMNDAEHVPFICSKRTLGSFVQQYDSLNP